MLGLKYTTQFGMDFIDKKYKKNLVFPFYQRILIEINPMRTFNRVDP